MQSACRRPDAEPEPLVALGAAVRTIEQDFTQEQFPALANGTTFLDNAGGSQVARAVADRLVDYLLAPNVQLGASYQTSQQCGCKVAEGRAALACRSASRRARGPNRTSPTSSWRTTRSICLCASTRAEEVLAACDAGRRAGDTIMVHRENEDVIRYLADRAEREGDRAPAAHAKCA